MNCRMVRVVGFLWALLCLAPFSGCAAKESAPRLYAATFGQGRLSLEVARTPGRRQLGLMHRRVLGRDRGMLFVFARPRVRRFWMRNTRIPLSIAYLDAGLRVVSIHNLEPYNEVSVPSAGPAQYALEVNRGWFLRAGVREGAVFQPGPALQKVLKEGVEE